MQIRWGSTNVDLRFFIDPETELPHIYNHGVTEAEVCEVLSGRGEDLRGDENSRMKIGQNAGRTLLAGDLRAGPGW
jgi:hypothetical protein